MDWGELFLVVWELFLVIWDFLKENALPIAGFLNVLAIISFILIRVRRIFSFRREKSQPSSIKAMESAVPSDQIAPTGPTKDSAPISSIGTAHTAQPLPDKKATQRKLTAILCADVVGYSRLMGADEEATIETLTAYRKVFTSKIKKHRGLVVNASEDVTCGTRSVYRQVVSSFSRRWSRGLQRAARRQWYVFFALAVFLAWGNVPSGTSQAARFASPVKIGALNESWGPTPALVGLRDGLVALGYREDVDFAIGLRFTQGDTSALLSAAKELVRQGVDILFAAGENASMAAQAATSQVPIVFVLVDNPVKIRLVKSFAAPGANITGVASLGTTLGPKRLELFRQIVPGLKRVLYLYDLTSASGISLAREYWAAAPKLGLTLVERGVRTEAEARAHLAALREGEIDGIVSPRGTSLNIPGFVLEATNRQSVPTMFAQAFFVESGGLASYGVSIGESGIQAARLVDKIIKGIEPAAIPVEVTNKTELVINLKAAKALGLKIPPFVLFRADRIIR